MRGASALFALGALVAIGACGQMIDLGTTGADAGADGGTVFVDVDGGGPVVPSECHFVGDCGPLTTSPPDCAVADCIGGKCVYRAKDNDFDGHATLHCVSSEGRTITLGDDCDDTDPQLFAGHPRPCQEQEDGGVITFPIGAPVGQCKVGMKSCNADGSVGACVGAVGPQPPPATCTTNIDEGCTGNPLQGCTCLSTNDTSICGSNIGECKTGVSHCQANGSYGPCVGATNPAARNCSSSRDNDCNGVNDSAEAACACPGGAAPGGTRTCNTHPQDGTGLCTAGSQTCVASGSSSAWSPCTGDVAPAPEVCDGADHDCNGIAGNNEPALPLPFDATIATQPINCTHIYACDPGGRAAIYYRTGVGFTISSGTNTLWTAYAPTGSFSGGMYPAGTYRIGHDTSTNTKLGPVGIASACCGSGGCAATTTLSPAASTQCYTAAP